MKSLGMERKFLLGKPPTDGASVAAATSSHQEALLLTTGAVAAAAAAEEELIRSESEKYGDLLQGDFQDNYHNLTLKHMMGLQYAADRTLCGKNYK